jgi:hypothetical protein
MILFDDDAKRYLRLLSTTLHAIASFTESKGTTTDKSLACCCRGYIL